LPSSSRRSRNSSCVSRSRPNLHQFYGDSAPDGEPTQNGLNPRARAGGGCDPLCGWSRPDDQVVDGASSVLAREPLDRPLGRLPTSSILAAPVPSRRRTSSCAIVSEPIHCIASWKVTPHPQLEPKVTKAGFRLMLDELTRSPASLIKRVDSL